MLCTYSLSHVVDTSHLIHDTPQSLFHFTSPSFMHNFNPFGQSVSKPPYSHSPPKFQGVQIRHQGSWLQHRLKADLIEHIWQKFSGQQQQPDQG